MTTRTRVGTLLVAAGLALTSLAAAQSRGGKAPRKPKPAPAPTQTAEAPAEPVRPEEAPGAAPSPDGGAGAPVGAPLVRGEGGDGGRLSPLTPAPSEWPTAAPGAVASPVDYDRLLADVAALRARVAAVSDTLFQSRIAVSVRTEGDRSTIARLVVSLDDGAVYTAETPFRAEDPVTVYDHAVAPGKHAVTVDVERRDGHDESFRTAQRSRFVVEVPRDQRLEVELRVSDDSDMGHDFPADKAGRYDLRVRAKATARPVSATKR